MILSERKALFEPFKEKIEKEINQAIYEMGEKSNLRDACEYALTNGGKRFRPLIVLMVAEALPPKLNAMKAALSVEFFHTASLIADDLPSMDNDDMRRDKPSLHKVYEESVAILTTYTLISMGYSYIQKNAEEMGRTMGFSGYSDKACVLALKAVSDLAGILGATGGQYLDLFPEATNLANLRKMIYQKTVTLFEISFILGWIFGGGNFQRIDEVKKCAYHLGMAFQIADDMSDVLQDKRQKNNIAAFLGKKEALRSFHHEMAEFEKMLQTLGIQTENFAAISSLLSTSIK